MGSAEKNFAAKEAIVARLQSQVDQLQRALRVRTTELDQADRHIARIEESLLKLKQAKRELRELKRAACGKNHPFFPTGLSSASSRRFSTLRVPGLRRRWIPSWPKLTKIGN